MLGGFREAQKSLRSTPTADAGEVIRHVGEAFLENVGGVTGVVFGSLFVAVGEGAVGLASIDVPALYRMFALGLATVKKRGKASEGDKTMVDALSPAVEALRIAAERGDTAEAALAEATEAAEAGMKATVPMEAKVGRARYQSGKGSGHVDAGAASICLFFETLSQAAAIRRSQ
jgi:dihydroxyacetone kinase-like protein